MRKALLLVGAMSALSRVAHGTGEEVGGFPSWPERVIHEWVNRARVEPAIEMTACGSACADAANNCYTPVPPLPYNLALNHSARFHADNMLQMGYFAHDSECKLVGNLDAIYPGSCDGASGCSCVTTPPATCTYSGPTEPNPTCSRWTERLALFGVSARGEIIASPSDPNSAFYLWLFESFPSATCDYVMGPPTNGHRWNILKQDGSFGAGVSSDSVGDFSTALAVAKIPSGSHYPRQAASIEAWANWYDGAGPKRALVDVDGTCQTMTLARGTQTNGAWKATLTGLGSGCHRYAFVFTDSTDATVVYPTTGSLGIGPAGSCADWNSTPVALGAGCDGSSSPDAGPPDAPAAQPDAPTAQPDAPAAQPDAPAAQPDAPVAQPDAPVAQPDAPVAQPDAPIAQPDAPVASSDAPKGSSDAAGGASDAGQSDARTPDASLLSDARTPDASPLSDAPLSDAALPSSVDAAGLPDAPLGMTADAGGADARVTTTAGAASGGCGCGVETRGSDGFLAALVALLLFTRPGLRRAPASGRRAARRRGGPPRGCR